MTVNSEKLLHLVDQDVNTNSTIVSTSSTIFKLWPQNETLSFHPIFWSRNPHSVAEGVGALDVTLHILQLIIALVGLILNLIFMMTIVCSERLYQQKSASLNISMAVSGLFTCGGILMVDSFAFFFIYTTKIPLQPSLLGCKIWTCYTILACSASSLNIPAIAIDRYLAISRPLHYYWIMSSLMMASIVGSVWAISTVMAIAPLFFSHSNVTLNTTFNKTNTHPLAECDVMLPPWLEICLMAAVIFIPSVVLTVTYIRIYQVTLAHTKSMFYQMALGRLIEVSTTQLKKPEDVPDEIQLRPHRVSRDSRSISEGSRRSTFLRRSLAISAPPEDNISHTSSPSILDLTRDLGSCVDVVDTDRKSIPVVRFSYAVPTGVFTPIIGDDLGDIEASQGNNLLISVYDDNDPELPSLEESLSSVQSLSELAVPPPPPTPLPIAIASEESIPRQKSTTDLDEAAKKSVRTSATLSEILRNSRSSKDFRSVADSQRQSIRARRLSNYMTKRFQPYQSTHDKAFRVLSLVVGTYVVCWIPLGVASVVSHVWHGSISPQLGDVMLWSAYCMSCINPIVYSLYNKPVYDAMKMSVMGRQWIMTRPETSFEARHSRGRLSRTYSYTSRPR